MIYNIYYIMSVSFSSSVHNETYIITTCVMSCNQRVPVLLVYCTAVLYNFTLFPGTLGQMASRCSELQRKDPGSLCRQREDSRGSNNWYVVETKRRAI